MKRIFLHAVGPGVVGAALGLAARPPEAVPIFDHRVVLDNAGCRIAAPGATAAV